MDSMVWVEVPIEEWNKNNSYGLIESIYPIIGIGDNSNTDLIIIDSYLDLTFYKPTHVLVKKPLSEVIKDKMPTEVIEKFVKEWMESDPESFEKNKYGIYMYSNDEGTGLNLKCYFEECLEDFRDKLLNNG